MRLPSGHPEADSGLREDVGGVAGIVTQFAPELADHGAHGPHVIAASLSPDAVQQVLVGQHPAGVGRKLGQHAVLCRGQLHSVARKGYPALGVGDCQVAQHVRLRRFDSQPPSQGRLDPGRKFGR